MTFIAPAAKLLQHIDRITDLKNGFRPPPVNVEIDLSNRCSLGCEWCHFAWTHTRGPLAGKRLKPIGAVGGGDLMDSNLALRIVDQLAAEDVRSVTWTGGGEPTLHPHFDDIIEYTAATGLEQGLYTHGGHIGEARANTLKRHLTFVYVSLDAADAGDYQRDKGVDRFAAACTGIRLLAAAKGEATVGTGFLLTERNWQRAAEMVALSRELGADYAQFRPTILYDQDTPDTPAEDTGWLTEALTGLAWLNDEPGVEIDLDRFKGYRDWQGHSYRTCWWSGMQTVITPNGFVWTCVNKREHPAAFLGDLAVERFHDLWERHTVADVDGACRVACRGHLSNLALDELMQPAPHAAFI